MNAHSLARRIAAGNSLQELTTTTSATGANTVFRIWREPDSVVLKIYGSPARQRREHHALNALDQWRPIPQILDSGRTEETAWTLFTDAGQWNLETLPENPHLAQTAGRMLRELHQTKKALISNLRTGIDQEWVAVDYQATLNKLSRYRARIGVSQDTVAAAQGVNPPFATRPVVSHTDATPRNFIVNNEGDVTLINWEWATLAPPEWDLTRAAWSLGMHAGPNAAAGLLEGYGRTIDAILLDRWIIYHVAQILVRYTERTTTIRPADMPAGLVHEFNRAVLGATN